MSAIFGMVSTHATAYTRQGPTEQDSCCAALPPYSQPFSLFQLKNETEGACIVVVGQGSFGMVFEKDNHSPTPIVHLSRDCASFRKQ